MKRAFSLALCLLLLLPTAACSSTGGASSLSPNSGSQATDNGGGNSGTQSAPISEPTYAPESTSTPTPEPTPTSAPTPKPTPAPTPKPTPTPVSNPVLVSNPITGNPLAYTVTSGSVYVQDLRDYMGAIMTVNAPSGSAKTYSVFSFEGKRANEEDIAEFVRTICSGAYNLELIDTYRVEYKSGAVFGSFAINYTGTGRVDATEKANFSNVECNLSVWYTIERDKLKGQFGIPSTMDIVDLGLRRDVQNESLSLAGSSAMAGLYRMPDGSYQTSDGRLSTAPGSAAVLRDGQRYSVTASFERDSKYNKDILWVRNFYRDEGIYFCTPANRLMTGDVFTLRDLYYDLNQTFTSLDQFNNYKHDTPFLGLGHDGDFITPRAKLSTNEFDSVTVRVMYWEPNVAAVYYIYAELPTAPHTVEALCAVSLAQSAGYTGKDNERLMYTGETIQLSSPREFMPNYELFTWELVEGAGVVELSGTNSAACTVKALHTGTAVVRISYNYGIDEPDVLTGINRNADHTKTVEYYIYVQ